MFHKKAVLRSTRHKLLEEGGEVFLGIFLCAWSRDVDCYGKICQWFIGVNTEYWKKIKTDRCPEVTAPALAVAFQAVGCTCDSWQDLERSSFRLLPWIACTSTQLKEIYTTLWLTDSDKTKNLVAWLSLLPGKEDPGYTILKIWYQQRW